MKNNFPDHGIEFYNIMLNGIMAALQGRRRTQAES